MGGGASIGKPADGFIDTSQLQRTIQLLIEHDRRDQLSRQAIGKHLFESYFGGDESLMRSKGPKPVSFTALAERAREETSWDVWDLYNAVIMHLVAQSLPPEIAERIPPSTLVLLDKVEGEARLRLAERLANGELVGLAARKAIREAGGQRHAGPNPRPLALAAAIDLERRADRADEDDAFDADVLQKMEGTEILADVATRLEAHVVRVQGFTAAVRAVLAARGKSRPTRD